MKDPMPRGFCAQFAIKLKLLGVRKRERDEERERNMKFN